MKKFQELLYNMALNEDEAFSQEEAREASDLYEASKKMSDDELAIFVAANDDKLRSVLGMDYIATTDGNPDLVKEYYESLTKGRMAGQGEGRFDPYGNRVKTIDDFMEMLGVPKDETGYSDDQRAEFTNKDQSGYFGAIPRDQLQMAAIANGYESAEELMDDIWRTGVDFQRRNAIEGYNPDNSVNIRKWLWSALKGFGAPRTKEAQLEGREASAKEMMADLVELGLNFVPGVGIVNRSGKVIAKIPTAFGKFAGNAAFHGLEWGAVPLGSQFVDMGVYAGTDNPRGDFDKGRVFTQAAAIGGAKGALKAGAGMAKNAAETYMGESSGKRAFKDWFQTVEDIGSKVNDNIRNRQLVLDRKAELAKKRMYMPNEHGQLTNATLDDRYVISTDKIPDDIINADNFRILTENAERFANTPIPRPTAHFDVPNDAPPILRLEDGRYVYGNNGDIMDPSKTTWTPAGSEVTYMKPKYTEVPREMRSDGRYLINDEKPLFDAIKADRDLSRYNNPSVSKKEIVRDAGVYAAFNANAHQDPFGLVSKFNDLEQKRRDAYYNKQISKLRPLVTSSGLSAAQKKANLNAIMDVMTYGLDNVPEENFIKNKDAYRAVARLLGSDDWKHWSEVKVSDRPTTSYSSAMPR